MLHDTRSSTTTYRVLKTEGADGLSYAVTAYPEQTPGAEEPIVTGMYRQDTLPKWMMEAINTLDVANQVQVEIPFYGTKQDNAYWFFGADHCKLAFAIHGSALWLWQLIGTGKNHAPD